jgi:ABC-type antimicrobial peptide transport system permease subunit
MNILLGVIEGFREIWSHKFRSFLTMLGIILGVASLMAMFSMTAGTAEGMRKTLLLWGGLANVEVVDATVPEEQEGIMDISPGRTYRDVLALRTSASTVAFVSPEQRLNGDITLTNGSKTVRVGWVRGVEAPFLAVERHRLALGRFFTDLDLEQRNRVVVLGSLLVEQLWGAGQNPLGERLLIDGHQFRVVGVFDKYNDQYKDRVCVMPLTTVQELWFGVTMLNGLDQGPNLKLDRVIVQIKDTDRFDEAIEQIRNVLNQTHRGIRDFGFNTREDWADMIESGVRGVRMSGGLIVMVTLIAGGVGITNIMLASIKERTREIGIRRAVGATPAGIFMQITLEAVVLSILAGILGLGAGYGLVEILKKVASSEQPPLWQWSAVFYSFAAAVLTGVFAGFLPAWKASRLHPIEALRFE